MGEQAGRRIIEVHAGIVQPAAPRLKSVQLRTRSDFPRVSSVYLDAAELFSSPTLMGPPLCEELIALVQHLFSEEEAGLVRHLRLLRGRSAEELARAEIRPLDQVTALLDRLANAKRAIAASGPAGKERYRVLPIVPGMFEMILIGHTPETLTNWHRRFVELFEALFDTGYSLDYRGMGVPSVRFLPIGKAIEGHPMALPSDKLEVVLDRYEVFGIGQCQCRQAMNVLGKGCGKPLGNCTVMGQWAERGIEAGWLQKVSKREAIEIKREAESHGLVNWMMNVASSKGQSSCSCCGCCCHAMRMVNEFNAPGALAPPHFLPKVDTAKCNYCGKCARSCPMGGIRIDQAQKKYEHLRERCIGCGLCKLACDHRQAIVMEAVPSYDLPYRSWFSFLMHAAPSVAKTAWKVWRQRRP